MKEQIKDQAQGNTNAYSSKASRKLQHALAHNNPVKADHSGGHVGALRALVRKNTAPTPTTKIKLRSSKPEFKNPQLAKLHLVWCGNQRKKVEQKQKLDPNYDPEKFWQQIEGA